MKSRKMSSKAGFTLVELMVVAIIVALLAAVAIPLMSANKKRAAATEGEAGLGTLRSCFRAIYAEKGVYNQNLNGGAITVAAAVGNVPGVSAGDLNGKYFVDANYTVTSISASNYTVQVVGNAGVVNGITITLNQDGTFTYAGM
jgi:prepilin-type N-terminal cleavage/methylation domain-containing protein